MSEPNDTKNPYLADVGIAGFIHNLLAEGRCDDGAAPNIALRGMSHARLEALAQQGENIADSVTRSIQGLGNTLAVAAATGEVDDHTMADMWWLVSELGELLEQAEMVRTDSKFYLEDPDGVRMALAARRTGVTRRLASAGPVG